MPITLLLDLDDTLLDTNTKSFAPAYFSALGAALADLVPPDIMLPALMGGTKAMMTNTDPSVTLREVFDAFFYPKLGVAREAMQERLDVFYDDTFPTLQHVTSPRPEAVEFVEWAFAAGHRVAIATNPFFPLKAVQHRLRWAGLPPEKYSFALVSSYETFHFTKENISYFPEFLGQLGWPEDPVVMVGNDPDMDLLPAQKAGLPVYWLTSGSEDDHPGIPRGTFAELRVWLESADQQSLQPVLNTPEAVLATLRATSSTVATMTASLPRETWQRKPAPGEWCLTEIVCHLRDVEAEVNLARIRRLLDEENPFVAGVVSDTWVEERGYASQDGGAALQAFAERRAQTLAILYGLQKEWSRTARHAIFGPTTLLELMRFVAEHDRAHIQQIWKTIRA